MHGLNERNYARGEDVYYTNQMLESPNIEKVEWFAIKTRLDFKAEKVLVPNCEEIFFPKEYTMGPSKEMRIKAVIPRVLFLKTTRSNILELEAAGRNTTNGAIPFWIYRYPNNKEIQAIPQRSIDLLRLLTSDGTSKCHIYTAKNFKLGQRVRITDGIFKNYVGFIKRIKKNRHVVVKIEGICMVILPFIDPDLLENIDDLSDEI